LTRSIAGCALFFTLTQLLERPARLGQIHSLRHDAFQLQLAGVFENTMAVAFHMLDVFDAVDRLPQDCSQPALEIDPRSGAVVLAIEL
jgi:hypothetical protein